jgi:hypothetical protein
VRFPKDYEFYCDRLGRNIHGRSWDRLIADLELESASVVERRQRLKVVADIRSLKPLSPVSVAIVNAYNVLQCLEMAVQSGDQLSGQKIHELISSVRPISFRAVQFWGQPHGLRLAATHNYQGESLKKWLGVILIRLPAMRKVQEKMKDAGVLQNAG